jgi:carboxyl-terminal processing protease
MIDYLVPDDKDRRLGSYTERGEEIVYYTTDRHSVDVPIAVICNEYTASAAELFTAAMRDYGEEGVLDTVIVGDRTYGKGIAQYNYPIYDMSGLTYTIGYFNPPCDVNFDHIGVYPDVTVEEVETEDAPYETAVEEVLKLAGIKDSITAYLGTAA